MAQNELHLKVTLRIYSDDDQRCFGPGIATRCSGCREHHSLRAGARLYGNGLLQGVAYHPHS